MKPDTWQINSMFFKEKRLFTLPIVILLLLAFQFSYVFADSQGTSQGTSNPTWQIMVDGKDKPVKWTDYASNPRFAIYDAGTPDNPSDDAVLDKETGLVWERQPSAEVGDYREQSEYSLTKKIAGRLGWRIPTVEEFFSIIDTDTDDLLTPGHPFLNVQDFFYWTSSAAGAEVNDISYAVDFGLNSGNILTFFLRNQSINVWCVRGAGGQGVY